MFSFKIAIPPFDLITLCLHCAFFTHPSEFSVVNLLTNRRRRSFITKTRNFLRFVLCLLLNVFMSEGHTPDDSPIAGLLDTETITDGIESDDGTEEITAQKVLEFLETAWTNEMSAPEILMHQSEMVELMMGQIAHMEENMKDLNKNDFRYVAHQMELERIRYIMVSYLRCRLRKIEHFTKHILNEESAREPDEKRLSQEETKFAKEYYENMETYFQQVALQYMPNMQRSEADQRIVRPNLMSHVFIKAKVSVPSVVVGVDDEEVDMAANSQHIIPYQLIADLIHKDQVKLI